MKNKGEKKERNSKLIKLTSGACTRKPLCPLGDLSIVWSIPQLQFHMQNSTRIKIKIEPSPEFEINPFLS